MKQIHLTQIDSTNLYLERHLNECPDLCSVRADIQTAGMGRLSRHWDSGLGGLWFSLLFQSGSHSPSQLQKICGLSALHELISFSGEEGFGLKWPNDIYYQSSKISGCLQKNLFANHLMSCIIGIGINVNNPIPQVLSHKAINLKTITGKEVDLEQLYQRILDRIQQQYTYFSKEALEADYQRHSILKPGIIIQVHDVLNDRIHTGQVSAYPDETLEIETSQGQRLSFRAADVTLKSWHN